MLRKLEKKAGSNTLPRSDSREQVAQLVVVVSS